MRKFLLLCMLLNVLVLSASVSKINYGRNMRYTYNSRLQIGVGAGLFIKNYDNTGSSYLVSMEYMLSLRWSFIAAQQLSIIREIEGHSRNEYQMRDNETTLMLGKSFFRNHRLKIFTGVTYGYYDYIRFIPKYNPEIPTWRCVFNIEDYDLVKDQQVQLSIPLRMDLKLFNFNTVSLDLVTGTNVYSFEKDPRMREPNRSGYISYLNVMRWYAMPVLKITL